MTPVRMLIIRRLTKARVPESLVTACSPDCWAPQDLIATFFTIGNPRSLTQDSLSSSDFSTTRRCNRPSIGAVRPIMLRFASYSIREKSGMTTTAFACPLCRGRSDFHAFASDTEYFTTPEQFEYRHCGTCDILFVTPMLADQLDLIYPKNYYSFDEGGEKNVVIRVKEWIDARLLRKILRTIPGNTIRVLDVGGGTGWLSSLVRDIDP